MNLKRILNTAVLTSGALGLWGVAQGCGPSIGSFCTKVCDCTGCSDVQREECVDSLEDSRKDAENDGCGNEWNDYLSCTSDELECKDDNIEADGCDTESEALAKCTAGGGGVFGAGSIQAYCQKVCDCIGCAASDVESCVTSIEQSQVTSDEQGCGGEFTAVLTCINTNFECQGGEPNYSGCDDQIFAYSDCTSG